MNKLVDGQLVPLTAQEIAQRTKDDVAHSSLIDRRQDREARKQQSLMAVRRNYPEVVELLEDIGVL